MLILAIFLNVLGYPVLYLIEKMEDKNPQIRKRSLQAFATLREVIPDNLIDSVEHMVVERTSDKNSDVKTQASWTLQGLRGL